MNVKNAIKNGNIIAGVCLFLLVCMTACDNFERKEEVFPEITVNEHSLELFVGETAQLKAGPTELSFTWSSEDTGIATVDGNGLVTAVADGATFIIARSGDMTCRVPITSITRIPLTGFSLNAMSVEANPGTKAELWTILEPLNANDASLPEWISFDKDIATVDYKGVITGVGEGNTKVQCTINGITKSVDVEVWVTKPFNGPHILSASAPYKLNAIDFDFGGPGNAYHDGDSGNSGGNGYRANNGDPNGGQVDIGGDLAVGWTSNGEWLIYTIDVEDAGKYHVSLDAAVNSSSAYRIEVDGENVTGTVSIGATGGWSSWAWIDIEQPITFTKGRHKLRFYFESAAFNFRSLQFTFVE